MAWISMDFQSKTLKRPVELEVLLPDSGTVSHVLFLLHGRKENRMAWLMKSQIECFAADKNICVVMPDGMNSFYTNTHNSYTFMDYVCKELPLLLKNTYYLPKDSRLWMIAGCDTGGYGALRCGLEHPEVFGHIASFSGTLDIVKHYDEYDFVNMWNVFGDKEELLTSDNNLYQLLEKSISKNHYQILLTCGKEDEMPGGKSDTVFEENKEFYRYVRSLVDAENCRFANRKYADISFLTKNSCHDWSLWNGSLKCAIEWFCGNNNYKEGFTCQ